MEEITLRGSRLKIMLFTLLDLALMGYYGWKWSQGDVRGSTKALTIVFALLILLKVISLIWPSHLRLSGGRFQVRMFFGMGLSTPAENVASLDLLDGKARMSFHDLAKVEASQNFRNLLQQNLSRRGFHLEMPVAKDPETARRLTEALVREPA